MLRHLARITIRELNTPNCAKVYMLPCFLLRLFTVVQCPMWTMKFITVVGMLAAGTSTFATHARENQGAYPDLPYPDFSYSASAKTGLSHFLHSRELLPGQRRPAV